MAKRKIDHQGRFTIPKEILEKYNIKKDDVLEIYDGEGHIAIKKYTPENFCVITEKITSKGIMFGNSFISEEGLDLIKKYFNAQKNHEI